MLKKRKMSSILLENALHAVFDCWGEPPEAAADETARGIFAASQILIPDGFGGNGTMRTARTRWLARYATRLIARLSGEC